MWDCDIKCSETCTLMAIFIWLSSIKNWIRWDLKWDVYLQIEQPIMAPYLWSRIGDNFYLNNRWDFMMNDDWYMVRYNERYNGVPLILWDC